MMRSLVPRPMLGRLLVVGAALSIALTAPWGTGVAIAQPNPAFEQDAAEAVYGSGLATLQSDRRLAAELVETGRCGQIVEQVELSVAQQTAEARVPDPGEVIPNSTCYRDIVQIEIPVIGGWISEVVQAVLRFLAMQPCNGTEAYFAQIEDRLAQGDFGAMMRPEFAASPLTVLAPDMEALPDAAELLGGTLGQRTRAVIDGVIAQSNRWLLNGGRPDAPTAPGPAQPPVADPGTGGTGAAGAP